MARLAIQTKILPATEKKGTRVKAFVEHSSLVMSVSYDVSFSNNHKLAALELAKRLKWLEGSDMFEGVLPNGEHCFVFVNQE